MRVAVNVVMDAAGRKTASLLFTSDDGLCSFACGTDGKGCRSLAAALINTADAIDKRIFTLPTNTGCPMCNGESPDYQREPISRYGTWVHVSTTNPDETAFCLDSPLKPPPDRAA